MRGNIWLASQGEGLKPSFPTVNRANLGRWWPPRPGFPECKLGPWLCVMPPDGIQSQSLALGVHIPEDLAKLNVVFDSWRNPGEGCPCSWLAALPWPGVPHLCAEGGP